MGTPDLIFCFNNSPALTQIALNYGFLYGHRTSQAPLPNLQPAFLDLDHRHPERDWHRHLALTLEHHPRYAIAGDATTPQELDEALRRARLLHAASPLTLLIIVPKTLDLINNTPTEFPFVTGYSLPTEFGATQAPPQAYRSAVHRRLIHILGGPPRAQLQAAHQIDPTLKLITSVDTNAHVKAAQHGTYWDAFANRWKRMPLNTSKVTQDCLMPAFARSSRSIQQAWKIWSR